mgnify:CR=1 FL=1
MSTLVSNPRFRVPQGVDQDTEYFGDPNVETMFDYGKDWAELNLLPNFPAANQHPYFQQRYGVTNYNDPILSLTPGGYGDDEGGTPADAPSPWCSGH